MMLNVEIPGGAAAAAAINDEPPDLAARQADDDSSTGTSGFAAAFLDDDDAAAAVAAAVPAARHGVAIPQDDAAGVIPQEINVVMNEAAPQPEQQAARPPGGHENILELLRVARAARDAEDAVANNDNNDGDSSGYSADTAPIVLPEGRCPCREQHLFLGTDKNKVFQSNYKDVFVENPSSDDEGWWEKIRKLTKLVKTFIRNEVPEDDVSMASDLTVFSEIDDSKDEEGDDDGVNDEGEGLPVEAPVVEDDDDPYSFLTNLDRANPRIPDNIYLFGDKYLTSVLFDRVTNNDPVNNASDIFTRILSRKVREGYNGISALARVRRLYDCIHFLFLLSTHSLISLLL